MSALRNYLNKIKPNFQEGGKLFIPCNSLSSCLKESALHLSWLFQEVYGGTWKSNESSKFPYKKRSRSRLRFSLFMSYTYS